MQYSIYHATQKDTMFTETENQDRILVGVVEADSLEHAYTLSQNGEQPWNSFRSFCRSTSVGDAIEDDKGFYMVCNLGFRLLYPVYKQLELTEADYWSGEPYLEQ